jgi:hypothetical protein
LSVLFILVWHPFPPELCPRPFVLTLDVAQRNVGEILFVSAYVSLTAYPQSALKSLSSPRFETRREGTERCGWGAGTMRKDCGTAARSGRRLIPKLPDAGAAAVLRGKSWLLA